MFDVSPDGGFPTVWRGFDKQRVEAHIRNLEDLISQLERQLAVQLGDDEEIRDALRKTILPRLRATSTEEFYTGLGETVEKVLRIAEEHASEIVATAKAEAAQISEHARNAEPNQ